MSALVVLCTAPSAEIATTLARGLVSEGLAACVNVVPTVRSFYRWEGELQEEEETQLIIKTHRDRFEALEVWLREHHPYDVPEIIALPIVSGSPPYLEWLRGQTTA